MKTEQVSSWSLGGPRGCWQAWFWWETLHTSPLNVLWKFDEDWPCGRASRLCPSSKSLPGVLEDMEVPDRDDFGGRPSTQVIWMVCESLMGIGHVEGHQDSARPPSLLLESWRTWRLLIGSWMGWLVCEATPTSFAWLLAKFHKDKSSGSASRLL